MLRPSERYGFLSMQYQGLDLQYTALMDKHLADFGQDQLAVFRIDPQKAADGSRTRGVPGVRETPSTRPLHAREVRADTDAPAGAAECLVFPVLFSKPEIRQSPKRSHLWRRL
jgi:hypothetical protein